MNSKPIPLNAWDRERSTVADDMRPFVPPEAYEIDIEREATGFALPVAQRASGIHPEAAPWPDPDPRLLTPALPAAPPEPLEEVFSPPLVQWFRQAAEANAAPVEYVVLPVLSCVAKLRMEQNRGDGPPFVKAAGCVVYHRADLDAWLAAHLVEDE